MQMEAARDEMITQNQNEKEDMAEKFDREKSELEQELAATQRDRDDSLMFAENEKQQVGVNRLLAVTDESVLSAYSDFCCNKLYTCVCCRLCH